MEHSGNGPDLGKQRGHMTAGDIEEARLESWGPMLTV